MGKLLEAAQIRNDENVIGLNVKSTADGRKECPVIYYHMKCRNTYTHWKNLAIISKVRAIPIVIFTSHKVNCPNIPEISQPPKGFN